jgi:hypothetical protein
VVFCQDAGHPWLPAHEPVALLVPLLKAARTDLTRPLIFLFLLAQRYFVRGVVTQRVEE